MEALGDGADNVGGVIDVGVIGLARRLALVYFEHCVFQLLPGSGRPFCRAFFALVGCLRGRLLVGGGLRSTGGSFSSRADGAPRGANRDVRDVTDFSQTAAGFVEEVHGPIRIVDAIEINPNTSNHELGKDYLVVVRFRFFRAH
jgi:hypothetical protein